MKKFLVSFIASIMAFSTLATVGCSKATEETEEATHVVLADFEKFEPDFQLTRISKHFGAVNVNTDATYVKSGTASAKIQPLGHVPSQRQPWLYFPLQSTRFEYDYRDFSYYESVSMWMYNAESETIKVELGFVEKMTDINEIATIPGEMQEIKPGWNKLVYYPDLNSLNLICDITNFLGIYLRFPNTPSYELEDAPVLYIDDVMLKKSPQKQEIAELIQLDENEILNFDKGWQQSIVTVNAPVEATTPEVSVVKASEENLSVLDDGREEDYVLKVVTKAGTEKVPGDKRYTGFDIPAKVVKKSGIADIEKAERKKYNICFDVYAVNESKTFFIDYGISMWNNWVSYNHQAVQGQWTTYRYNLSLLSSGIYGDLSLIGITWGEYAIGGDMTFYFDNFRIEYVGDE